MIDFSLFFRVLGFENAGHGRWMRRFDYPATGEYVITVDTDRKTIDYPRPIVLGDRTTSNFDHPENFVVLECVCRLLAKGYDPATLILEKRYQLGRGASGGKSDITVLQCAPDPTDQENAPPLLIIECKTYGPEHDAEKRKTTEDGGQLFSYLQQDRSAAHLCIYSSQVFELTGEIEYRSDLIHVKDTPEARDKFAKKEKAENHSAARQTVPLFDHAYNRETLHHAWKTTYAGQFHSRGIFEEEFTPYVIGYQPLRRKDLKEFNGQNGSTKVFNTFMEILRHNNVSDKENAFNRLCAIILAKLVDEDRSETDILSFQWLPNKDTAEDLIDRLQRLYKRGMKDSLGEEITYFEEKDIDNAFMAHRRDMARNEVKKIFRALKFYTNNDFAFKEVHNRKLFEQNTQVVREVVELFQGYRLKYTSKQAFLGNLFELLLNSGFKQSEGQFFTPIPIARFIVRCLPLRERIAAAHAAGDSQVIPKVMDYACGSAHFLTEVIEELQEDLAALDLPQQVSTTWARDCVWGIEKDYRLARTAKIALFLHGAGDANILHADGLEHDDTLPKPGTLDVLIANPPYSVKDFKQHLNLRHNGFTLLPHLTSNSGEIETLFVERAAQLLTVGGLAGLILPSSILSNSGIYQRTRALLLEKFLVRGIVELGGSAFIATGTNTIILLLERRFDTHRDHFAIRADALFHEEKCPNDADFADSDLLLAYSAAAGLDFALYCQWLADPGNELPPELEGTPLFIAYQREFDDLAETKRRKEQKTFQKQPKSEQQAEMRGKFLRYCREAEKTKFVYFALVHTGRLEKGEIIPQWTTVLRSADNKAEEQAFLGYKWSQRRGAEGMVFLREPYDGGTLYTPDLANRDEPPAKAAHHFRKAFLDAVTDEPPDDSLLVGKLRAAPTPAFFDFSRTGCDLALNLSPQQAINSIRFETQFDLIPFGQVATLEYGKPLPERSRISGEFPVMGSNGIVGYHNEYLIKGPAIIVGRKGSAGKITYIQQNCFPIDTTFYVSCDKKNVALRYLEAVLQELKLEEQAKALGVPGLNRNDVYKFFIPLPPLPIQKKIVEAIEAIEVEETEARQTLETTKQAIEAAIADCQTHFNSIPLSNLAEVNPPKNLEGYNEDELVAFIEMAAVTEDGKLAKIAERKLSEVMTGYTCFREGDVLLAKITPCMENGKIVFLDALTYKLGFGSTEFFVIRAKDKITAKVIYHFLNRPAFRKPAERAMTGASGHRRVPKEFIMDFSVPALPPTEHQVLLEKIAAHEDKRREAEIILAAAAAKKRQILLDGIK